MRFRRCSSICWIWEHVKEDFCFIMFNHISKVGGLLTSQMGCREPAKPRKYQIPLVKPVFQSNTSKFLKSNLCFKLVWGCNKQHWVFSFTCSTDVQYICRAFLHATRTMHSDNMYTHYRYTSHSPRVYTCPKNRPQPQDVYILTCNALHLPRVYASLKNRARTECICTHTVRISTYYIL